jgi:hypothetical protein
LESLRERENPWLKSTSPGTPWRRFAKHTTMENLYPDFLDFITLLEKKSVEHLVGTF